MKKNQLQTHKVQLAGLCFHTDTAVAGDDLQSITNIAVIASIRVPRCTLPQRGFHAAQW